MSADQFVGVTAIEGEVDVVHAIGLTAFDCVSKPVLHFVTTGGLTVGWT